MALATKSQLSLRGSASQRLIASKAATGSGKTIGGHRTVGNKAGSAGSSDAYLRSLPGITQPFPDVFDPANLAADASIKDIRRWRESEITHGRVAMLAAVGFVVQENIKDSANFNFLGGKITGPAIYHFQQIRQGFWEPLLIVIGLAEAYRVTVGWATPVGGQFNALRDDYELGNLGFDPLGIAPKDPEEFKDMQSKELNNGRLAMIAVFAFTVQELLFQREFLIVPALHDAATPAIDGAGGRLPLLTLPNGLQSEQQAGTDLPNPFKLFSQSPADPANAPASAPVIENPASVAPPNDPFPAAAEAPGAPPVAPPGDVGLAQKESQRFSMNELPGVTNGKLPLMDLPNPFKLFSQSPVDPANAPASAPVIENPASVAPPNDPFPAAAEAPGAPPVAPPGDAGLAQKVTQTTPSDKLPDVTRGKLPFMTLPNGLTNEHITIMDLPNPFKLFTQSPTDPANASASAPVIENPASIAPPNDPFPAAAEAPGAPPVAPPGDAGLGQKVSQATPSDKLPDVKSGKLPFMTLPSGLKDGHLVNMDLPNPFRLFSQSPADPANAPASAQVIENPASFAPPNDPFPAAAEAPGAPPVAPPGDAGLAQKETSLNTLQEVTNSSTPFMTMPSGLKSEHLPVMDFPNPFKWFSQTPSDPANAPASAPVINDPQSFAPKGDPFPAAAEAPGAPPVAPPGDAGLAHKVSQEAPSDVLPENTFALSLPNPLKDLLKDPAIAPVETPGEIQSVAPLNDPFPAAAEAPGAPPVAPPGDVGIAQKIGIESGPASPTSDPKSPFLTMPNALRMPHFTVADLPNPFKALGDPFPPSAEAPGAPPVAPPGDTGIAQKAGLDFTLPKLPSSGEKTAVPGVPGGPPSPPLKVPAGIPTR